MLEGKGEMNGRIAAILVSDFNIGPLAGFLSNAQEAQIDSFVAPFGQVYQTLIDRSHECWQRNVDAAIVWTRPEAVVGEFRKVLQFEAADAEQAIAEVDRFTQAIQSLTDRVATILVPNWVVPAELVGYGMLDMRIGLGIRGLLSKINLRLMENLQSTPGVYVLDTNRWLHESKQAFNAKMWYLAKVAFDNSVFKNAARDIGATFASIQRGAKKIIVVDLDDTLWGGIVGDVGWRDLCLGGHDPIGEAFVDFQRALKSFTNRGILLGIVSKNDEQLALQAIEKHPEMILRPDDFAGWRINWDDKAQNLSDLMTELNLGLDSAVFLDDNPVERQRVRDALPDVLVPEMPNEKMLYPQTIMGLTCFSSPTVTKEDLSRTEMYRVQRARESSKKSVGSIDQWLVTLETKVVVQPMNDANCERASQLLAKTNQMNLTTRRLSESELSQWVSQQGHEFWTFRVSDRFGDSGLTGIASLEVDGNTARIVDFILSCRVMGRKIEEVMVHVLVEHARSLGLSEIIATYIPTDRNKPCLEFWKKSKFDCREPDTTFSWSLRNPYPAPECIDVTYE